MKSVDFYYTGIKECDEVLATLYQAQSILERALDWGFFLDKERNKTIENLYRQVIGFEEKILNSKKVPKTPRLKRVLGLANSFRKQ